jgi:hypothetical protein
MSLDDALAAWAAGIRLSDTGAADIYQQIVRTPTSAEQISPGLDATWWRHFNAGFTTRMITSTRTARWAA